MNVSRKKLEVQAVPGVLERRSSGSDNFAGALSALAGVSRRPFRMLPQNPVSGRTEFKESEAL